MRPRPIPRKTQVMDILWPPACPGFNEAAADTAENAQPGDGHADDETASMRPRPIPRKTSSAPSGSVSTRASFNEAAADTAENAITSSLLQPCASVSFNEAAADTAENVLLAARTAHVPVSELQ